jgi:hypothetical protein
MRVFPKLWAGGNWEGVIYVIADTGYDFYDVHKPLREAGKQPVIPRRKEAIYPRVPDKRRYQTRSNIEGFFDKIKENKRLALRIDKLDTIFFAFFALATLKTLKLFC